MTDSTVVYALAGIWIAMLGLRSLLVNRDHFKRIVAANLLGSGVFLTLVALAGRGEGAADPIPHGMILTGIVVAVSGTGLFLALLGRLRELESSEEEET